MSHLSPTIALTTCEQALRALYASALNAAYGDAWLDRVASDKQRARWRAKRETERRKRTSSGVVAIQEDELAYAEFRELCDIAEAHWPPLASALGELERTLPLLRRFEALRNTVAHSRPLLPFEEDLLSGIAGEIRNRVTIHMTDQDLSDNHFARIETVTDSFGHQLVSPSGVTGNMTETTVRVGDVVHFACRGTDPHDRLMRWELEIIPGGQAPQVVHGTDVELSWPVGDSHVGQQTSALISMTTDATHHRFGGQWDGRVTFIYTVLPAEA